MIVLIYNAATLVMLAVAPSISIMWVNTIQSFGMLICGLLVIFVQVKYLRSEDEKRK